VTATREALLNAVIADPGDDLPRLVFADWCDEHGEPDCAEFIRLQVSLAGLPAPKEILANEAEVAGETDDDYWSFLGLVRRQPKVQRLRLTARTRTVPAMPAAVGEVVRVVVPEPTVGEHRFAVRVGEWDRRRASFRAADAPTWEFTGEVVDEPPGWAEIFRVRNRIDGLFDADSARTLDWFGLPRPWARIVRLAPFDRDDPDYPYAVARRGFIEAVHLPAADWLAHGDAVLASQPVTDVTLTTPPPKMPLLLVASYDRGGNPLNTYRVAGKVVRVRRGAPVVDVLSARWPRIPPKGWHLPPESSSD
jgi:uncharacterized protein (TIGR02996 family)